MSIGRITVDLLAKTGSFETSLDRAAKHAQKRAKEIDNAVSKAGVAVGAALSAAGVAAVYFGKQLIDGLDALNDYKDATGASIENLSALESVALKTGTNMESVSGVLVKFNNVLKEVDGKNGASQVLKNLGLDAEELKRIDPAEALRLTAVAFSKFESDGNSARNMQELFGKSVKEAASFMKDLSEETKLLGTVTTQQAEAAEVFNKQLFALQANATNAGRSIVSDLLPAMNKFLLNAREIGKMGGFGLIVKDAAKDMIGLGKMTGDNGADIKKLMKERDALQAAMDSETRPLVRANDGRKGEIAELNRYLELLRAKQRIEVDNSFMGQDFGDAVSRRAGKAPSLPDVKSGSGGGGAKKAARETESEFQKYLENLDKQLLKTKELGVAETVLADIESGRLGKVSPAEKELALSRGEQLDALKALADQTKINSEFEESLRDARLRDMALQEQQVQNLTEGNKTMREEIELLGLGAEAQAAIEQARISSTIAILEQKVASQANKEFLSKESAAISEQIRLLTERKDLVGMRGVAQKLADDAAEAKQFASQVGAAFESSFEKAILEGGKLSDVLKGLAKDILGLYIRNSITGPLAKSIGSGFDFGSLTSLFSGGGGGFGTGSAYGNQDFGGFFANGGSPPLGKVSVVGENGPELFVPNTRGSIIPNHALGGGGGGDTYQYNFTVGDVATASMVREAVANSERRTANGFRRSRSYAGEAA